MNLDLNQLKTFCVVAEEENISRAAERLYLSAPAVSAHIKALEDELGVELFSRSSRGMTLTEAGNILWDDVDQILKKTANLRRKAIGLSGEVAGVLRIGINNPPDSLHVPELIANLGAKYPKLRFEYEYANSQYILRGLRQDAFDIGFFEKDSVSSEISAELLEERPLVLIAPKAWAPDLRKKSVKELEAYPWLFVSEGCSYCQHAKKWCSEHGLSIEPRITADNDDCTTVGFVARELGISVVSEESLAASAYHEGVEILHQLKGNVSLYMGYRKDRRMDALVSTATQAVRELFLKKQQPLKSIPASRVRTEAGRNR
jgi:DNA-binding transcriptional LysR family regulator